MTKRSRRILTALIIGIVIGLCCASLMMYVAWNHNAQGEIQNENGVNWYYWMAIGLSWFAVTAPIAGIISWFILFLLASLWGQRVRLEKENS